MGCTLDHPTVAPATPPAPPRPLDGIRVVAFDLDGTLVDILRVKARAAEAAAWALADAGLDAPPARAAQEILATALAIGIDREDVVDAYLARTLGRADARLVAIARHAFERAEDASVLAYPRTARTLLELARRGYELVLITDAPRRKAVHRLQAARLTPFFSHVIAREDTPHGKADRAPYDLALSRAGVPADALCMVGDHPRLDVGVAQAAGCRAVLAEYGLQPAFAPFRGAHEPDATLQWIDDLLLVLPGR